MKRGAVMDCSNTKNNLKSLYFEAYKAHDNGDRDRLLEICRLLFSSFPNSEEARWAVKNFNLTAGDFGNEVRMPRQKTETSLAVLRFIAWIDLAAGTVGATVLLSEFGTSLHGIIWSIAAFMQGVFVCSFFLVIASIAANLFAIRENTGFLSLNRDVLARSN
jgi:hypothetical protein